MKQELRNHDKIRIDNRFSEEIFFIQHIEHSSLPGKGIAIPPVHRHPYYEIIFVTSGKATLQVDFQERTIKKGTVCLLSPAQVHQPINTSKDYSSFMLRFYPTVFDNKEFFSNISIFDIDFLTLDEEQYEKRYNFLQDLHYEFTQDQVLKNFALGNLLKCFLISLQRIMPQVPHDRPKASLFTQFNSLIVENEFQIKLPSYYTQKLKVPTRTLNSVIKEYTGQSSREYIRQTTLLEAKRLLNYTTLSIKEIAHNLGFEDTAYFSRFFKQSTNQSPIVFRDDALAS